MQIGCSKVDKKIRDNFYENAMKTSTSFRDRKVLTHSDIIQSRVTTDQDLKAYLMNIQQRNLPKGGNTGFIYDGESSEFRRPGKGGTRNNYMKMQRTQITNLPGSMMANTREHKNYHSFKKPVGYLQATSAEIEAKYGMRKDSPDRGIINPAQTAGPITSRPVLQKNKYAQIMTLTPRHNLQLPPLSPFMQQRRTSTTKAGLQRGSSPVLQTYTEKDMMSNTIGGQTWTTRDVSPSPFAMSRSGSAGSRHFRPHDQVKQLLH